MNKKTGDVRYQLDGIDVLSDTGQQVAVLAQTDEKAIAAGLMLASQKFGQDLTLSGSPEFQKLAVETAVKQGLGVTFKDAKLERYRSALIAERQAEKEQKSASREAQNQAPTRARNMGRGIGD